MNVRRGLFRLWIIFACCFVFLTIIAFFPDLRLAFGSFDPDAFLEGKYDQLPGAWNLALWAVGIAIGIPLAVLGLGRVLLWASEGFGDSKRNSN